MKRFSHQVDGDAVPIFYPEDDRDLDGFHAFLAKPGVIALDTETSGLRIYSRGFRCRLVQFGRGDEAWVLQAERFRGIITATLRRPDLRWVCHNASFDILVLDRTGFATLEDLGSRVFDTYILAHLIDPRTEHDGGAGLGLKPLSNVYVDNDAADTSKALYEVFRREYRATKATGWDLIDINHPLYVTYAGLDVIYTARLLPELSILIRTNGMSDLAKLEHRVQLITTAQQKRGLLVDVEYTEKLMTDLEREAEEYAHKARGYGVENINSTKQVIAALQGMGEEWATKTASGNPAVGKEVLLPLADLDKDWKRLELREPNALANAIIRSKRASKWGESYVRTFLEDRDENDRIHPFIKSLAARTARMCLPETERLVTRRGVLHVDDVRVGDETLDRAGEWVPVTAIHRYLDAEIVTYRTGQNGKEGRYCLTSTREHRWLQRSAKGRVFVEPITTSRPTVLLAPESKFDPFDTRGFMAATEGERFASLIALLATDGRLYSPTAEQKGAGMSALVYQTERKFYREILGLIPEGWLSYDRITNASTGGDHHEMGFRVRSLRPHLESRGLLPAPGTTLRHHPGLWEWAAGLPLNEAAAFTRAVYLADGTVASGHRIISAAASVLRDTVQMTGYRLGWLSTVQTDPPSEWSTKPREKLSFRPASLYLRDRTETAGVADVWCVTTESGTFTASGAIGGLYLTGNSVSNPPLQQLPSSDWTIRRCIITNPGELIAASDYSAVEMRVLAALADVAGLKRLISEGADLHTATALLVYGEDAWNAAPPKEQKRMRTLMKTIGFGKVYGGGPTGLARQSGLPYADVKHAADGYDSAYPEINAYGRRLQRQAAYGGGAVVTPIGRRLPLDRERAYAATNYTVQSTARDILAEALIRIEDAGLGAHVLLPVHDELVCTFPAADAEEGIREIGRLMETEINGVPIASDSGVYGPSWGHGYGATA